MEVLMIKLRKIVTCCVLGTLVFASKTAVSEAAEMPIAGIDLLLDNLYLNNENANIDITKYFSSDLSSEYANVSFAKVTNYVNIRSKANEESEILGKLYTNAAATILENVGEWYKIKSGSVTGYIKAEYLITGTEAEILAKTIGNRIAIVTTTTLKVREKANTDSAVITLVPIGEELIVKNEADGWVKVSVNGGDTGFVSTDYVDLKTEYEEAVSIEEEQERLEAEEAASEASERERLEIEEIAREAREQERLDTEEAVSVANERERLQSINTLNNIKNKIATPNNESNSNISNYSTTNTSSIRSEIVKYALQFEGNPYVWRGTSLTNGADCSGYIQSVFRDNGISIPRTSRTQATGGRKISIDNVQPGDLIFYDRNGTINHVAIYIGNGKVIAASSPKTGIRITNYNYRQPYKAVSYID